MAYLRPCCHTPPRLLVPNTFETLCLQLLESPEAKKPLNMWFKASLIAAAATFLLHLGW